MFQRGYQRKKIVDIGANIHIKYEGAHLRCRLLYPSEGWDDLMTKKIRLATEADAGAVLEIYGPICETSPITFEIRSPTVSEIEGRIRAVSERYPWLVCEHLDKVLGYAYASGHHERAAYRWSIDVAVYISEKHRGKKVGTALYTALFELLRVQGFFKAYAGITLPNPASVRLHQRFGFESIGVHRSVGYKAGAWHDVSWWELTLRPAGVPPDEPTLIQEAVRRGDFVRAMKSAENLLGP
jgi:L-amino acid N-acyltransferase YncA